MPWWAFAIFIGFVIAMLLVDLEFFHTEAHTPTLKESGSWVTVWVSLALIFGVGIWVFQGGTAGGEFFAGYLIEYSLSVDNMFVFVLIFSYFQVPLAFQHQVLFYGILGAMIFRGIFIFAGTALINNFEWVIYIFGAFLIFTAFRITFGSEEVHPENNPVLKFARKRMRTTHDFDGQKLFTIQNGARVATPLLVTLIFIEVTDIVFAVDSIPAIFSVNGSVHRVDVEARDPWSASALLPAGGVDEQAAPPQVRTGDHPRLRWRQDAARGGRLPLPDLDFALGDRRGPGSDRIPFVQDRAERGPHAGGGYAEPPP